MGTGSSSSLGSGVMASPLPEFLLWAQKEQGEWVMHSGTEKQQAALQGSRGKPDKEPWWHSGSQAWAPAALLCVCVPPPSWASHQVLLQLKLLPTLFLYLLPEGPSCCKLQSRH